MLSLESKDFKNTHDVLKEQNELIQKGLFGGLPEDSTIKKSMDTSNNPGKETVEKGTEEYCMYKAETPEQQKKMKKVMDEWKAGTLKHGTTGEVVTDQTEAIAIAMSEAGISKKNKKKKSEESPEIKKAFETIGLDIEKSEGSRGGKVIGHTTSGKAIYDKFNHATHKEFNHDDHEDAARLHGKLSDESKDVDDMYHHSGESVSHWEEHYKKGGKYKDSLIGHTKSGKPIMNKFSSVMHSDFTPDDHMDAVNAHTGSRNKRREEIIAEHGSDKSKVVDKMNTDKTIQSHSTERQNHLDEMGKQMEKEKKYKSATLDKIKTASPEELKNIHHAVNHPAVGWSESGRKTLNEAIENRMK